MDRANSAPRGDWKGDHEETQVEHIVKKARDAWKGEKPMNEARDDENGRLRRDLGQSPDHHRA